MSREQAGLAVDLGELFGLATSTSTDVAIGGQAAAESAQEQRRMRESQERQEEIQRRIEQDTKEANRRRVAIEQEQLELQKARLAEDQRQRVAASGIRRLTSLATAFIEQLLAASP
jgi:hypothetical protein